MESGVLISSLFLEIQDSINIIWDFILISFRLFGEPDRIHKCYFAEFKRQDRYWVNIKDNLLGHRGIEISKIDWMTFCIVMDVVMQESLLARVS